MVRSLQNCPWLLLFHLFSIYFLSPNDATPYPFGVPPFFDFRSPFFNTLIRQRHHTLQSFALLNNSNLQSLYVLLPSPVNKDKNP